MTKEEGQEEPIRYLLVVKLFASSREIVGKDNITLKLTDKDIKVRDLRRMILELFPSLSTKIQFVIAVNHKIADESTTISYIDEVAILPPVSGG
jgi:molybdopterin converting factor subunit 1